MLMSIARTDLAAGRERPPITTDDDSSKSAKTKCDEPVRDQPPPRKIRLVEKKKTSEGANRKLWDYIQVPTKQERQPEPETEFTEQKMQSVLEENRRLEYHLGQCERQYDEFIQSSKEVLQHYLRENIQLKQNSARLQISHLELFDDINQKQQQLLKVQEELKTTSGINGLIKKVEQSHLKSRLELQRTLSDKNKRLKRMFFYQSNCCFRVCTPTWPLVNQLYQPTELCYRADRFQLYKALNIKTLEDVAIKLYYIKTDNDLRMVEHEYRLHSKLDHPNIIKCQDFFEFASDKVCMVFQWAQYNLQEVLTAMDEKSTLEVLRMTAEASKYLRSKQIVHRNIRTGNILIVDGVVKLSNFYWALEAGETWPELPLSESVHLPLESKYTQAVTQRLDVWSLGVLLYECLAKTTLPNRDLPTIRKLVRELCCSQYIKRALTTHFLTEDHQRCTVQTFITLLKK